MNDTLLGVSRLWYCSYHLALNLRISSIMVTLLSWKFKYVPRVVFSPVSFIFASWFFLSLTMVSICV
jgi:hypothetical protein